MLVGFGLGAARKVANQTEVKDLPYYDSGTDVSNVGIENTGSASYAGLTQWTVAEKHQGSSTPGLFPPKL